eukprot:2856084-Rhodomonas_salina.2
MRDERMGDEGCGGGVGGDGHLASPGDVELDRLAVGCRRLPPLSPSAPPPLSSSPSTSPPDSRARCW